MGSSVQSQRLRQMSAKTKKGPCGTLLFLAEGEGFEPSIRFRIHTFQACAFDHSATSPKGANHTTTHPIGQPETVKKMAAGATLLAPPVMRSGNGNYDNQYRPHRGRIVMKSPSKKRSVCAVKGRSIHSAERREKLVRELAKGNALAAEELRLLLRVPALFPRYAA